MTDCGVSYAEGGLEFLFVVDDVQDPAHSAIAELLSETATVSARILVATHATANSQKIHKCVALLINSPCHLNVGKILKKKDGTISAIKISILPDLIRHFSLPACAECKPAPSSVP